MVALQRLTVRESREEAGVVRSAATALGVPAAEVPGLLELSKGSAQLEAAEGADAPALEKQSETPKA